jgi:hypothetical protein
MISATVRVYPLIFQREASQNPIYQQIAASSEGSPIYVEEQERFVRVLDFLRDSRLPSVMANCNGELLSEVVQRIDSMYTCNIENYTTVLNEAIAADLRAHQGLSSTPHQRDESSSSPIGGMGMLLAMVTPLLAIPVAVSAGPLILTGCVISPSLMLGVKYRWEVNKCIAVVDTQRDLGFFIASRNRRDWLINVEIAERIRVRDSRSLVDRRIETIRRDILQLEELGVTDQRLGDEIAQLEAVRGALDYINISRT